MSKEKIKPDDDIGNPEMEPASPDPERLERPVLQSPKDNAVRTRSGRVIRPPKRLDLLCATTERQGILFTKEFSLFYLSIFVLFLFCYFPVKFQFASCIFQVNDGFLLLGGGGGGDVMLFFD